MGSGLYCATDELLGPSGHLDHFLYYLTPILNLFKNSREVDSGEGFWQGLGNNGKYRKITKIFFNIFRGSATRSYFKKDVKGLAGAP